jgi:penicillin-binding protein 2
MFHRRLVLVLVVMLCATAALAGQLVRLTILHGNEHLQAAEKRLTWEQYIPTVRGDILDRKGRVIAADQACLDLAVDYEVISGYWAYRKARAAAYRLNRGQWHELSVYEREARIDKHILAFEQRVEAMWQAICDQTGLTRERLEERKQQIMRKVHSVQAAVWSRQAREQARRRNEAVSLSEVAIPIEEQTIPYTLCHAVDDSVALYFRKHAERFPGLRVIESKRRVYPLDHVVVHVELDPFPPPLRMEAVQEIDVDHVGRMIVGTLRELKQLWVEDVDPEKGGRPFHRSDGSIDLGGYRVGDWRGHTGVEFAAEDQLRGLRGRILRRRDTGEQIVTDPTPGENVQLTVDMHLQARIQALMHPDAGLLQVQSWHRNEELPLGTPLNGAAVVLEVDSGQVLAMVSSPAGPRDDDAPPGATPIERWPRRIDHPEVNRPVAAIYPPGSTLKPIVYCLAARDHAIQVDQVIECRGHLLPEKPNSWRCWGWRPDEGKYLKHGSLDPVAALAQSCNIYFYTCGKQLGPERLVRGLREFGYGRPLDLGLPEGLAGILPDSHGPNPEGHEMSWQNATFMAIGQGPIAATPLHVATAHAALARGGYWLSPVLFADRQHQQQARDLNIPPRVIENALRGMYESANNPQIGTGHQIVYASGREKILNLPGVICRSKTGTAQAPDLFDDLNDNGQLDPDEPILIRDGAHSWYVCHVQREGEQRAAYVIVVLVEYGGSGGRVSGPLANQILYALRDEGYL